MKTAPNSRGRIAPQPSAWRGKSEQILLDQVGCEARKIPAEGDVFFLDFYIYRTYRDLAARLEVTLWPELLRAARAPPATRPCLRAGQCREPFSLSAVFTLCKGNYSL